MKTIVFFFLLLVSVSIGCAQNPTENGYYARLNAGDGTHFIIGVSIHHTNKKGYSLAGAYTVENRDAPGTPRDYEPGFTIFYDKPQLTFSYYSFLAGKVFCSPSNLFSFDLRGGMTYGTFEYPVNFERRSSSGMFNFGSNYNYELQNKVFVGAVFNPSVDFRFSRILGVSFSARGLITPYDISLGFEGALIIGYLRGKRN